MEGGKSIDLMNSNAPREEELHEDSNSDSMCKIVSGRCEDRCEETCPCDCNCQKNETELADSSDEVVSSPAAGEQINKVRLSHGKGKNPKLRTSKDVYDRLKWDSESIIIETSKNEEEKLDTSSIYVGYKDRFLGMCELTLDEFSPGGDIPFHRVYYFRTGGPPVHPFIGKDGEIKVREDNLPEDAVFIWDRDSRTDLVFKSGNSTVH